MPARRTSATSRACTRAKPIAEAVRLAMRIAQRGRDTHRQVTGECHDNRAHARWTHRQVSAARRRPGADHRQGLLCGRHAASGHAAHGVPAQPVPACQNTLHTYECCAGDARRGRRRDRRRPERAPARAGDATGAGHEDTAASPAGPRRRPCGGRACRRRRGPQPRAGARCRQRHRGGVCRAAGSRQCRKGPRAWRAARPRRAGQQHLLH